MVTLYTERNRRHNESVGQSLTRTGTVTRAVALANSLSLGISDSIIIMSSLVLGETSEP